MCNFAWLREVRRRGEAWEKQARDKLMWSRNIGTDDARKRINILLRKIPFRRAQQEIVYAVQWSGGTGAGGPPTPRLPKSQADTSTELYLRTFDVSEGYESHLPPLGYEYHFHICRYTCMNDRHTTQGNFIITHWCRFIIDMAVREQAYLYCHRITTVTWLCWLFGRNWFRP